MKVIGLDVSSSIVGVTVLDENANILVMTHINLTKIKGFWEKVDAAHAALERLLASHLDAGVVAVEEPAMRYSPGMSSAQTISTLLRFNALISWKVRALIRAPIFITASSARKECGIRTQRVSKVGLSHKQQTFDQLTAAGGFLFGRSIELTSSGKIKPFVYDEFDSYVLARAALMQVKRNQV